MRVLPVVLARGWSRRVAGDKALLPWQGRPLISHALQAYTGLPGEPVIVTKFPDAYREISSSILEDRYAEETPMSGILTAAAHADSLGVSWIMISGADTLPLVDNLFSRIWSHRTPGKAVLLEVGGKLQPFPGLYHRSNIDAWKEAFDQQAYHLTPVAARIPSVRIRFCEAPFININTRGQLSAFEQTSA